jgi:hypothetical protein
MGDGSVDWRGRGDDDNDDDDEDAPVRKFCNFY